MYLLETLPDFNQVMVFIRTRDGVHALTSELNRAGVTVDSFHGSKNLSFVIERSRSLEKGKSV